MTINSAYIFTVFISVVVLFQLALALGVPWGNIAMGGRYPGKFPPPMRIAAIVQALVLAVFAYVVLVRAHVLESSFYSLAEVAVWIVVALMGLSFVMHLITPSKWERIIWTPVVIVLFTCSLIVALS
ncbi:MAG: hypothetical protein AAF541_12185 [Pseudomonadota bacterium]